MAQRVDDTTGEASDRLSRVIVMAVRLLRIPTAIVLFLPIPAILVTLILGISGSGWFGTILIIASVVMGVVAAAFWGRRRRILQAVEDPELLARELQQLVNLTGRMDEGTETLRELTTTDGLQVFSRLRAAWRGVSMPARWLDQIGELPRARYFAPPKIGTTTTVTVAALWLVPVSLILAVFAIVGSIAGSL